MRSPDAALPLRHGLGQATAASLVASAAVVLASVFGLAAGPERYAGSGSILVSRGADAANLVAVTVVVVTVLMARRGSWAGLLLWPGGVFYLAYAMLPYLIGAPFTSLLLVQVVAFLSAAYAVIALAVALDDAALRDRFAAAPAGAVGAVLTGVGVLAYAGLAVTAAEAFGEAVDAAWRGHWVADWVLGTPVLVAGGILLWARRPFGFVAAPALLLVSALGGVVFSVAALVDNAAGGAWTDPMVVAVHLVISVASLIVLVWFLRAPERARSR